MKLIEIEQPYIDISLNIKGIDDNKALLDTGFSLGINVPLRYKNVIMREAMMKGKKISSLSVNVADGRKLTVFATGCTIKINDKKIDASITCLGELFIVGREVITQIMEEPSLAVKGEKIEVTI